MPVALPEHEMTLIFHRLCNLNWSPNEIAQEH
jgi:hypothetical protein